MPHNWVAMIIVPVETEVAAGGVVNVFHTELAEELAKEDSVVACWACDAVLGPETVDTECTKASAKLLP